MPRMNRRSGSARLHAAMSDVLRDGVVIGDDDEVEAAASAPASIICWNVAVRVAALDRVQCKSPLYQRRSLCEHRRREAARGARRQRRRVAEGDVDRVVARVAGGQVGLADDDLPARRRDRPGQVAARRFGDADGASSVSPPPQPRKPSGAQTPKSRMASAVVTARRDVEFDGAGGHVERHDDVIAVRRQ